MAHEGYHEPVDKLSAETHGFPSRGRIADRGARGGRLVQPARRARAPIPSSKAILAHNRDEEIEHASMTLEWIRRRSPAFDKQLREALFKSARSPASTERRDAAIARDSLMSLEAYAKARAASSARACSRTRSRAPCIWAST